MKKTGSTFEKDIYTLIKASPLKAGILGEIYRDGMRPFNSEKEDAVVSFMTGIDGQFQTGVLNINVYIPDINNGAAGKLKNIKRCNEIEDICSNIVESLRLDGYRFSLASIIQTFKVQDIDQHFVNVKLKFDYITF